jgi:Lrp/AsnC family transcriptional regulator
MKPTNQIDDGDRRLLRILQNDAGLSQAALADLAGLSTASCWRRIQALEAKGVLGKTVRLVDPNRVERSVNVLCNVRMKSHAERDRQQFESFIDAHPEVMECYSMSGEWDYLLRILVSDVAAYERFLMRELLAHQAVATAASHFALSQVKYTTAVPVGDFKSNFHRP